MDRLAELRESQALTLRDLAERSGVDANTINQVELGHRKPRPSTLRKLAKALHVEVADFFREPAVPLDEASGEAGPSQEDAVYEEATEEFNQRRYGSSMIAQGWDRLTQLWNQRLEKGDFDQRELKTLLETLENVAVGMEANAEAERKLLMASYGTEAARDKSLLRPAINRLGLLVREILKILEEGNGEASGVPHKPERPDEEMPDETVVPFPDRFQKEAS